MMKKFGFTLAEVLITLMIIGVIAMLVVPGVIQRANDRATVAQVKSAYSAVVHLLHWDQLWLHIADRILAQVSSIEFLKE